MTLDNTDPSWMKVSESLVGLSLMTLSIQLITFCSRAASFSAFVRRIFGFPVEESEARRRSVTAVMPVVLGGDPAMRSFSAISEGFSIPVALPEPPMGVEVPEVEADGAAEACDEAEPLSREDWEVLRLVFVS